MTDLSPQSVTLAIAEKRERQRALLRTFAAVVKRRVERESEKNEEREMAG